MRPFLPREFLRNVFLHFLTMSNRLDSLYRNIYQKTATPNTTEMNQPFLLCKLIHFGQRESASPIFFKTMEEVLANSNGSHI